MNSREHELTAIIREVAKKVEFGDENTIMTEIPFLCEYGIEADMHTTAEDKDGKWTKVKILEWYGGQLITIAETKTWFAVNSWLNCVDKFAPEL